MHCGSGTDSNTGDGGLDASVSTQTTPFINRVNPTSGPTGTTVTIFGSGFSNEAPNNIVTVGSASATAATYTLLANPTSSEIESLTFTVPTGAPGGSNSVFVTVFDNTSNTDVTFTVNP